MSLLSFLIPFLFLHSACPLFPFYFILCPFVPADAVDLGSPDELMDISEVDEGVWPVNGSGGVGAAEGTPPPPPPPPPTITISNSVTTLNLGAKAMKKCRFGSRSSKDKDKDKDKDKEGRDASPLAAGRATSENAELSVKRLTLTSSQSVPKAGALTNLTRTASAVFSRSFEQTAGGSAAAAGLAPNHVPLEAGRYSCSPQEDGLGYLSSASNHTQRSPSISVHLGSDL